RATLDPTRLSCRNLRTIGGACAVFLAAALHGSAAAQMIRGDLWVPDRPVTCVGTSPAGDVLYIGGAFTKVGPPTGSGGPISASTGLPLVTYPKVTGGLVNAVEPDGSGGWFIGGDFTAVGGVSRSRIAHILSDGSLSSWNPSADSVVTCLALSGSLLYVGGRFGNIGGQFRGKVAALDVTTGAATGWNPNANDMVEAIAVGSSIYVGGSFATIGGQARSHIAALDATTGLATSWNPNADGPVFTLVLNRTT